MSFLSRMTAPTATHELAELVSALLSHPGRPSPPTLPVPGVHHGPAGHPPTARPAPAAAPTGLRLPTRPTGLGTTAVPPGGVTGPPATPVATLPRPAPRLPTGPNALVSAPAAPAAASRPGVPELYCPPAVRDDRALGDEVNERLVSWAEEIGIYPGQLDRVRSAGFGRLIMLAHPECDDVERLLAAARCALAEWSVDDHYVDGEAEETVPELLGQRLAIAHSVIDQAHLPTRYAPQLETVVQADPVMRALRSALDNLLLHATSTQVRRLRHELGIMFVAYNQEGVWRNTGHRPPVWEYLMHRHENSFIPCMVLIDAVAGYQLPSREFADPRVRRAFTLAGTASVLLNDLYSMAKEDPTDTNLPRLLAEEEDCSLADAVQLSVELHDELMHTFEREAAALSLVGSPMLQRWFAGVWAWLGGNREWHSTTERYHGAATD